MGDLLPFIRFSQTYDALEKSNQLVLFKNIEIGDFGVAKCNENQQWHRARVIMCVDLDQIQIVFIDFGILEVKSVRQFFPIDKYFTSLPAQAIACSLSEVRIFRPINIQIRFDSMNSGISTGLRW